MTVLLRDGVRVRVTVGVTHGDILRNETMAAEMSTPT